MSINTDIVEIYFPQIKEEEISKTPHIICYSRPDGMVEYHMWGVCLTEKELKKHVMRITHNVQEIGFNGSEMDIETYVKYDNKYKQKIADSVFFCSRLIR